MSEPEKVIDLMAALKESLAKRATPEPSARQPADEREMIADEIHELARSAIAAGEVWSGECEAVADRILAALRRQPAAESERERLRKALTFTTGVLRMLINDEGQLQRGDDGRLAGAVRAAISEGHAVLRDEIEHVIRAPTENPSEKEGE